MRKSLLFVLLFAASSFAIDATTLFWTVKLTGDTITVSKLRYNYDSLVSWTSDASDTMNQRFVRVGDNSSTRDSTVNYLIADTLRGAAGVDIDTIKQLKVIAGFAGLTIIDTVTADSFHVTNGILVDGAAEITGTTILTGAVVCSSTVEVVGAVTLSGTVTADSMALTKGMIATTGTFSGAITATTGTLSGTVNVDSLASTKGLTATTGTFSGAITATTGTFSGAVDVDSLASAKGITATTADFSGTVDVDSLASTKGLTATTGTFSGNVQIDGQAGIGTDTLTSTQLYAKTADAQGTIVNALVGHTLSDGALNRGVFGVSEGGAGTKNVGVFGQATSATINHHFEDEAGNYSDNDGWHSFDGYLDVLGGENINFFVDSIGFGDSVATGWGQDPWWQSDTLDVSHRKIVHGGITQSQGCDACTNGPRAVFLKGSVSAIQNALDGAYSNWGEGDYVLIADSVAPGKTVFKMTNYPEGRFNTLVPYVRLFAVYRK